MISLLDIHQPVTVCKASAGTGKTYTLAAYYVGLLLSGEDYRSILAITFTNKATAEMSERIIGYLYGISQGKEPDFLARAREFMLRDQDAPDAVLQQRAGQCFQRMLLDFDNVHIMTIDAFLQSLLSGLAGVLRVSAGLTTELDIDHVIRQAVDQLLTTDMTPADRTILEDYMQLKLDEQSHWDVRKSLCAMAKELYNESVQILDAEGRICFDAAAIARRREALEQAWREDEGLAQLKTMLKSFNPESYNKNTKAAYDRLVRSVEHPQKVKADDRFRGVTEKSSNAPEMLRATELANEVGRRYNTIFLTIRFSRDMQLMASLQALIQRNLSEANSALLARTAGTLTKALQAGDADFILEKAGIRYHHVLIDEFQDTSRLQWGVIRQLLQDLLASEGNTLLIVGDIKQSIYRWRNGDWHIMDRLAQEPISGVAGERINTRFTSLTKNFRSSEEVVRFNLSLFRHLIDHQGAAERIYGEDFELDQLERFYQANKKRGGYVHFQAIPNAKKEDLAMRMFEQIDELLAKGAQPRDIMILVREKKEAALITSMTDLPIVSADSFLLEASEDVRLIIAGLRVLADGDDVSAQYIEMVTGSPDFIEQIHARITPKTPLYEAMCELVAILLTDEEGRYTGSETAYVNNLLDRTRAYVSTYGSRVADFLTYWDDTMHKKAIPASASNAIRILTVHASKGLQAQTLFVPFCMWPKEVEARNRPKVWCEAAMTGENDFVPIQDGVDMERSAYSAEYEAEHENMRVDNLNMLYVALTRAEDNLYISTSYSVRKDGKPGANDHVGMYIKDFVGDSYEAGEIKVSGKRLTEEKKALQAELWANSDQVRFVQSQEGAMYTDYGEEAYRRVARMDEGTLCHEIFAHLRKADELEAVLDEFESQGQIHDKAQREALKTLISSAWEGNDEMRDWFTAPWELKLEEAIYMDHKELRPDRVMINPQTNEAIVLDYKFGIWENQYIQQVREYMDALRRIGHSPVRGYLWFARDNKLVPVTPKL